MSKRDGFLDGRGQMSPFGGFPLLAVVAALAAGQTHDAQDFASLVPVATGNQVVPHGEGERFPTGVCDENLWFLVTHDWTLQIH